MRFKTIIWEKEDGIGRITLNRADKMNAITLDMLDEIESAQQDAMNDGEVRALIVTGRGRAFCSGADFDLISLLLRLSPKKLFEKLRHIQDVITVFEAMEKPVIAAINGYALGGGLDLALACDFRIAAKGAKMGEQYVKAGLMPDVGGTQRLPRLVGLSKAKEMIFLGEMVEADEAQRIGLVNKVVSADELEAETRKLALELASAPTTAIGLAKKAIREGLSRDIQSGLETEAYCETLAMQTMDAKEGLLAIREKRKPNFTGQ